MADLQQSSPLPAYELVVTGTHFRVRELAPVTKLRVQVLRSRGMHMPAVSSGQLPTKPNTTSGIDPIALWRAPDDWLVCSQTLTPEALSNWVAAIPADAPLVVTNVSSASAVFELSGPDAIDILMRDCTLDLEGDAIPLNGCAQTQFAQTTVMLHRPSAETWRLFVERSVALHVWEWLLDTAGPTDGVTG